ncbi:MAG: GIY-YIG nuclease family protein [Thermoprotei archaeon]|nr:MAG: GIY-YIG nuclease family protein [Thermoprotei archaeon]
MSKCLELLEPGIYVLLVKLNRDFTDKIGSLGLVKLNRGLYLYIGSAKRGLLSRLKRYCLRDIKNIHWHIDYLVKYGEVLGAYIILGKDITESYIANIFSKILKPAINRFGATDTKDITHLFNYHEEKLKYLMDKLGFTYINCDEILQCMNFLAK